MAKRESKKRIFAREQVEVDERTSGIKGSSARVDATGSLYGRSNTHAGSANSFWASVSPTLDRLTSTLQIKAREESAEAKAERERQRVQEEKLQYMLGRTAATESDRALEQAIIRGEVQKDPQSIRNFLMEQHELANPTHDPSFRLSYLESAVGTMQRHYGQWNEELKSEYMDTGKRTSMMALTSLFRGTGEEGEINTEELKAGMTEAIDNMVSFHVPVAAARQHCFDTALSSIRERGLKGDSIGAVALIQALEEGDILASAAPVEGRSGFEQVEMALHQSLEQFKAKERRDEEDAWKQRVKTQNQNFHTLAGNIGQAKTPDEVKAMEGEIQELDGATLYEKFGPDGVKLSRMLENQKEHLLTGKRPDGNLEARIELERLVFQEDQRFIHEDGFLESYSEKLLPDELQKFWLQRESMRQQKDPGLQSVILESMGHLQNQMNPVAGDRTVRAAIPAYRGLTFLMPNPDPTKPPTATDLGYAIQERMWEEIRNINPSDPKYLEDKTALYRDQVEAIRRVENQVKSGKADWLVERANIGRRDGEEEIKKDPSFFTEADLEDPQKSSDLQKHFFGAGMGLSTQQARINRIQDPKVKERVLAQRRANIARTKAENLRKEMEAVQDKVVGFNMEEAAGYHPDPGARATAQQELGKAQQAYILAEQIANEVSSYVDKEDKPD